MFHHYLTGDREEDGEGGGNPDGRRRQRERKTVRNITEEYRLKGGKHINGLESG